MPTVPPRLRKCAEIFVVETTQILIYKCTDCSDWFSTHPECQTHVQAECPGESAVGEADVPVDQDEAIDVIMDEYGEDLASIQETHQLGKLFKYF